MARDVIAGIGFRHAAGAEAIVALVGAALRKAGLPVARLSALATAADRAGEPAFTSAAAALGVPGLAVEASALRAVDASVPTRSERIAAARGVGSLAEAAALAASGGVLILPRIKAPAVTCALARCADRL